MKRKMAMFLSLFLAAGLFVSTSMTANAAPHVDPYGTVQAELNFGQSGVDITNDAGVRVASGIDKGDYWIVKDVEFSNGLKSMTIVAKADAPAVLEVRMDDASGEVLGNFKLVNTNGQYKTFTAKMKSVTDKHVIAFVGAYGTLSVDSWTAVGGESGTTEPTNPSEGPYVDPYKTVPAKLNFGQSGIEHVTEADGTEAVAVEAGDYWLVKDVKFSKGVAVIGVNAKADKPAILSIKKDSVDGQELGTIKINSSSNEYKTYYVAVPNMEGRQKLVFQGKFGKCKVASWTALSAPTPVDPEPVDPEPVDPEPVDPTPVDPTPVAPTPVDPTPVDPTPVDPTPVDPEPVVTADLAVDYTINSWGTGFTVNCKIVNNSDAAVNGWTIKLKKSEANITNAWCVELAEEGEYYVITPAAWNGNISANGSVDFGFQGAGAIGDTLSFVAGN